MADFLPLIGFVFLGLFSPGPNVILLTASGARFGFMQTLPHIFGVAFGVGMTSAVTGLGVGTLLAAQPMLVFTLTIAAAAWILWMAYNLWRADPAETPTRIRPFTFLEAVLFQWVNPKVWAVALSAMAYVPAATPAGQSMIMGITFSILNLGVCLFWTMTGALLSYLLNNVAAWRIFMRVMRWLWRYFQFWFSFDGNPVKVALYPTTLPRNTAPVLLLDDAVRALDSYL